uniref:Putative salivary sulfotransferase n=1 Tax=Ixodes ricinus TaxID=34613 RepID=A0A0K8R6X8_IXORI
MSACSGVRHLNDVPLFRFQLLCFKIMQGMECNRTHLAVDKSGSRNLLGNAHGKETRQFSSYSMMFISRNVKTVYKSPVPRFTCGRMHNASCAHPVTRP